jgi:hypothetical protein
MNPSCFKCAHFVPTKYGNIGYCSLFARFKGPKGGILKPYTIYQFSEVIRDDPTKCGPEGLLFKKKVLSPPPRVPLVSLFNKDENF